MSTTVENCSIQRCPCSEKQGHGKDVWEVLGNDLVSFITPLPMLAYGDLLGSGQMGCMPAVMPKLSIHMTQFKAVISKSHSEECVSATMAAIQW